MAGPMTVWPGTQPGYTSPDEVALSPFAREPMFGGYSGTTYTGSMNVNLGSVGPLIQMVLPQLLQSLTGSQQQPFQFFPQHSVYDQLRAYEFFLGNRTAMQTASSRDIASIDRMIGGVTQMFTGQPLTEQQRAQNMQKAQTLAQWTPLLAQLVGPDLLDQLHGSRGSATIMAQQLHHALRTSVDPITGQIGYRGESAGRVTQELYERLFGEETSLTAMQGLSAGQAGMLASEMQIRGLLGRPIGALPVDERRAQLPETLADSTINRLAMQLPQIRDALSRGETPSETAMEAARQTIRTTHTRLKDNTQIFSEEDLRQLEGAEQLISTADADRIQRRLENMAGAVKAMRDIFGDMGNPNAPMREIINGLDQLTQGGLATMSPSDIERTVRQTHALAQQTGIGVPGMMALMSQGGVLTDQLGLNRAFAVASAQHAAAFGAAAGDVLRLDKPVWDGQTKEQMMLLDQQLMAHAAASPMAQHLGSLMRMVDTGMATPAAGSELEAIVRAVRQQRPAYTFNGQTQSVNMPRARLAALLAQDAGLSATEMHAAFMDVAGSQEFIARHRIDNTVRQAMPQDAIRKLLGPVLSNRFGGLFRDHALTESLINQGVLTDENDGRAFAVGLGRDVSQRFLNDRDKINPDVIRDPTALRAATGQIVRESLKEQLRQRQPHLTDQQLEQLTADMVQQMGGESRLPVIGEVVVSSMNAALAQTPYRNARNWWEMNSPEVLERQAVHARQAEMTGIIQSATSHLGNVGPAARFSDALQKATSKTTLADILTQTFGSISQEDLVGADPTGVIAQMLKTSQQLNALDPRDPAQLDEARRRGRQLRALVEGGQAAKDEANELMGLLEQADQFTTPEALEDARQMLKQLQAASVRGPDQHILGARGIATLADVSRDDVRALTASSDREDRQLFLSQAQGLGRRLIMDKYSMQMLGSGGITLATSLTDTSTQLQQMAADESKRLGRDVTISQLLHGENGVDAELSKQALQQWNQLQQSLNEISTRYQDGLPAGYPGTPGSQNRAAFTDAEEQERRALALAFSQAQSPEERADRILQKLSQRATTDQSALLTTETGQQMLQPELISGYRAQRLEHALYSQEAIWNMAIDRGLFGDKTSARELSGQEKDEALRLLEKEDLTAEERQQLQRWSRVASPLLELSSDMAPEAYLQELQKNIQAIPAGELYGQLEKPQAITAKVTGSVTINDDGTADLELAGDGVMDKVTSNIGMA